MLSPNDFNRHFTQHSADMKTTERRFVIAACIWGTISLSITGGTIYVAIHFIQKFW